MAWGDLRETSAVMSAVKGRHDDFAGGTVSNNNTVISSKMGRGETRGSWDAMRG
jgi:hypothetical protein